LGRTSFYRIITGKEYHIAMKLAMPFLRLASTFYSIAIRVRNLCYDKGWLKQNRSAAKVICVGNITVGGTGKTPLVIWITNFLTSKGLQCAILTRGYKSQKGKFSDEPAVLAKSCPDAKVIIEPDRVAGACRAVEKSGARIVIMDDGFQHRRLARDLDIVAIDAICPFGYNRMLPAGLLREPVSALLRAGAAVITRSDQVSQLELENIERKLRQINPSITIAKAIHKPLCAKVLKTKREPGKQRSGPEIGLEELRAKSVFAFCGIGNPDAFMATLKQLGLNVVASKIYDDHHRYAPADIDDIYEEARYLNVDIILTTQKDWTKTALMAGIKKDMPLAYLAVRLQFTEGEEHIRKLLEKVSTVTAGPV
jgi:tetraacyldisaccharide 4'-kinase